METFSRARCRAVAVATVLAAFPAVSTRPAAADGFEVWPHLSSLPPAAETVYLSPLGSEHAFVDLGYDVSRDGEQWRALQFTRDQTRAAPLPVGKYLFGVVGDEWPHRAVEVLEELRRGRLTALVVDGVTLPITPSRLLDLSTPEKAAAAYNAFPRLLTPGPHTVQYVWEQRQDFFFKIPLTGGADPLGLGGRRVFVKGEKVGDVLDDRLVVTHQLNPVCADGLDNDGDGLADFPSDPGCAGPLAPSESTSLACDDGADNDGDGLSDFPADPGCAGVLGLAELTGLACDDGTDNDGDGQADYPYEPDCQDASDGSEEPECADGLDNDGDSRVDLADADCASAADRVEAQAPDCGDGRDNDADGLADHPEDAGCHAANDASEAEGAASEPEDARVLVVFASAGTLNGDVCTGLFTGGDGSAECPGHDVPCAVCGGSTCGNGVADDSRLFQLKQSLSGLFVRTDAEFGLLRSWQRAGRFTCPSASPLSGAGGWQGGGFAGCTGGFTTGTPLVAFAGDSFWSLWRYVDGEDDFPGATFPPPPLDAELRGTGSRPLGGLLELASSYLESVRASDPVADCRSYTVVVLTDGGETCGGDPSAAAGALSSSGMPVHVVGFAVPDATRAELNAMAAAGGTGAARFTADAAGLSQLLDAIADGVRADAVIVESCNGRDDDCDGQVDEGFPGLGQGCDNGLPGVCHREGLTECSASGLETQCALQGPPVAPSPETCNGLDDDCDGFADEQGVCGTVEVCNDLDDDADGLVDEDFPVGAPCTDGGIGVCRGSGSLRCRADHGGVYCHITQPGATAAAADTTCDGLDDDCDGALDEDALGVMVTVGSFRIDGYEASRPDATATDEGRMEHRPCSKPGALPWRAITWADAATACAAAGKRLCTGEEWDAACRGGAGRVYPYGNEYNATWCNGRDRDPGGDFVVPTGSLLACVTASGVSDLSGNVAEWVDSPGSGTGERQVRGGAFDSHAPALSCQFEPDEPEDWSGPAIGFRCCTGAH